MVFVSLFNSFGNIEVRGEEYFSAPSEQSMLYILGISIFGLFVVTFFLRRIHAKHLQDVDAKMQAVSEKVVKGKKKATRKKSSENQGRVPKKDAKSATSAKKKK